MVDGPWFLQKLASDVVMEGAFLNGSRRGPGPVTELVKAVIEVLRDYAPVYEIETGDRRVQEYTATVDGQPVKGVATFHLTEDGLVDEFVVNHRPLSATLTLSRLVGDALGHQHDEFYRPTGQSYDELVAYAAKQGNN
jgi:hypothetical protein